MHWNLTADGVWNLFVADFGNHACAGDCFLNHLWAPFAAADRATRTLHTNRLAAAWIAWINDAFPDHRARNVTCFRHPFATTFLNSSAFRDGFADSVTDVFVAGF